MIGHLKARILFLSLIASSLFVFSACTKEFSGRGAEQEQLIVYLTDHPADFDKVFVQINVVEVKLDTSSHMSDDSWGDRSGNVDDDNDDHNRSHDDFGQWDTLQVAPGNYDLLTLRNGVDTLLAQGRINGKVRKIRITIGSVSVVKDSVSYPVELLPGAKNYIYVKVRDQHMESIGRDRKIWIDFDVSRSIVESNGKYYLRPVLKPFCEKNSGGLEGKVGPREAKAIVRIYNATDTATAIPGRDGEFKVRGLSDGVYSVWYQGSNGYRDTTINNVSVSKGREGRLPLIVMRK
jgi:Domain of unknown function (DUF4382)